MDKGKKRRQAIQEQTKILIFEKGYGAVTMTDIADKMGLSIGGLYYHYHSVEDIVLAIFSQETSKVWELVEGNESFDGLIETLQSYFKLEKQDLLHFNVSVNSIIYQYFFNFPTVIREEKMGAAYRNVLENLRKIFEVFLLKEDVLSISNHVYIVLHGLTILAMTGEITEIIIDCEFERLIELITIYYEKKIRKENQ